MIHGQMKWVEKESFLRITVLSPLMISRMAVRVRQYTSQGRLIRIEETFDVISSSTKQSFFLPLVEGWIESISAGDSNFIVSRGRVFVQLAIQTDNDKINLPHTILAADYFASSVGLQWPGTPIRQYRDGAGYLTSTNIGNPAAGNNFSYTISTPTVNRISAIGFQLVTDVTVATRTAGLEIVIGGISAIFPLPGSTQASNVTNGYSYSAIGNDRFSAGVISACLPSDLYLKKDDILRSKIINIQAGDQLSNIVVAFEEWVEERS